MNKIIILLTIAIACGKRDKDDNGPQPPEHSFGSKITGVNLDGQNYEKILVGFCVSPQSEVSVTPKTEGYRTELGIYQDSSNKNSADLYIRETLLETSNSGYSFKEIKDIDTASNLTFEELPNSAQEGAFRLLTNAKSKGMAQPSNLDLTPAGTFILLASYEKPGTASRSKVTLKGCIDGKFMPCKRLKN